MVGRNKSPGNLPENISPEEIRAQLEDILKSKDFVASQRLMDFLSYVVEQSLQGNGETIKAYNIAVDVFGMGTEFDPLINPLVRTEAVRLRSKLEHYYLCNPTAAIQINIPKGGYVPIFTRPAETRETVLKDGNTLELHTIILVCPFENINSTREGDSFNSGLVNEITNFLAKFRNLTVIVQEPAHDAKYHAGTEASCNPSARFILKGSLQTHKKKFKLWVQLIDSQNNRKIWAESFNGDFRHDAFEAQEIIAEKIVYQIAANFGIMEQILLKEADHRRMPGLKKALLLYHCWLNRLFVSDFKQALIALQQTLQNEGENPSVLGMLADLYATNYQLGYGIVKNALDPSLQMAIKAANLDPECQVAHRALAFNYFLRGDKARFLIFAKRTLEINPISSGAITNLASWYGMLGYWDECLELSKRVFRLNPASPGWCHAALAFYHYYREDYEKALLIAQKINMPQMFWDPLFRLIAAAQLRKVDECKEAYSGLTELFPNFEKDKKLLISRSIPNPEYAGIVNKGLDVYKSLMEHT